MATLSNLSGPFCFFILLIITFCISYKIEIKT